MISNDAVQRLIDCDRETLIDLLAAAMSVGSVGSSQWDIYLDMDIRALFDAARARNARPVPKPPIEDGMTRRHLP